MSNLTLKARISNRDDARAYVGARKSRELCYMTRVHNDEGTIYVTHHGNAIAHYRPRWDVIVELSNAGWNTRTTATRLHRLMQAAVDRVDPLDRRRFGGYLQTYGIGITRGLMVLRVFSDDPGAKRVEEHVIGDGTVVVLNDGYVYVKGD